MAFRLVPENTKIEFMGKSKLFLPLSAALVVLSVILLATMSLNFGIDFKGGTMIEVDHVIAGEELGVGEIRSTLSPLGLGDIAVQEIFKGEVGGTDKAIVIRIEQQPGGDEAQQGVVATVKEAFKASFGDVVSYRRVEVVGPKVGGELIWSSIIAVFSAIGAILLYIWFRFDTQFGIGAILALMHDVVITLGVFSLFQIEFGLPIIAALLTIAGYSINDTVVIYDRVRENLRKYKKLELGALLNQSINETLARTVMTSVTTLLALVALYILGGPVIRDFIFAMIFGVFVGTYSSIFIASPTLYRLGVRRDWSGTGDSAVSGIA